MYVWGEGQGSSKEKKGENNLINQLSDCFLKLENMEEQSQITAEFPTKSPLPYENFEWLRRVEGNHGWSLVVPQHHRGLSHTLMQCVI